MRTTLLIGIVCGVLACGDDDEQADPADASVSVDDAAPPDAAPAPIPDAAVDAAPTCYDQAAARRPVQPRVAVSVAPVSRRGAFAGPVTCDPVAQTGCAAGERCAFVLDDPAAGSGHVGCVADGPQGVGDACTGPTAIGESDDCAAGGHCYRGVCRAICSTVSTPCEDGECVRFVDGNGDPLPIDICLPSCDLLLQDCGAGEGCYLSPAAVCVGAGSAGEGEPCASANGCLPGLVCLGSDEVGRFCRKLCGPWMPCMDDTGNVVSCDCGTCAACGPSELCTPLGDGMGGILSDTAGICTADSDLGCDCSATPICP